VLFIIKGVSLFNFGPNYTSSYTPTTIIEAFPESKRLLDSKDVKINYYLNLSV
jgi:hypothetical protein